MRPRFRHCCGLRDTSHWLPPSHLFISGGQPLDRRAPHAVRERKQAMAATARKMVRDELYTTLSAPEELNVCSTASVHNPQLRRS